MRLWREDFLEFLLFLLLWLVLLLLYKSLSLLTHFCYQILLIPLSIVQLIVVNMQTKTPLKSIQIVVLSLLIVVWFSLIFSFNKDLLGFLGRLLVRIPMEV